MSLNENNFPEWDDILSRSHWNEVGFFCTCDTAKHGYCTCDAVNTDNLFPQARPELFIMRLAVLGAAGYVAEKHYKACQAVGGEVVAIIDPHDSVGRIDAYAPHAQYFRYEDDFYERAHDMGVTHIAVCTPNHLHPWQTVRALKHGFDVILEKPVALQESTFSALLQAEQNSAGRVHTVLQMRLHPLVQQYKNQFANGWGTINIQYHTYRGDWYVESWKGDRRKSGGIIFNIGVHLLDLVYLFSGDLRSVTRAGMGLEWASAAFTTERGYVSFDLDTAKKEARRIFTLGDIPLDLTDGINLHNEFYETVMDGTSTGLMDAMPAVKMAERLTYEAYRTDDTIAAHILKNWLTGPCEITGMT